jgi:hypothetical protein
MSAEASLRAAFLDLYLANGVTGIRDLDTIGASPETQTAQPEIEPATPGWLSRQPTISHGWIAGRRSLEDLQEILSVCSAIGGRIKGSDSQADERASQCEGENARMVAKELSDGGTWVVPSLASAESATALPVSERRSAVNDVVVRQPELDFARRLELVRQMHTSGVQFLTGTNGPGELTTWFPMQRELEALVAAGFTPMEAIQAATYNSAQYMAKLDRYGVIEASHIADVILLDGNPVQDVHKLRNITAVVLRGRYFSRIELDAMLAHAQSEIHHQESAAAVHATER